MVTLAFTEERIAEIENIIGFDFRNKELLKQCFTLSSASGEKNNERLEFLGDAVIELVASDALYRYSEAGEGDMTKVRQNFVSNAALKNAVERLGLHRYLVYSGTDRNIGTKPIASLFEALTAGIYLEGGLEAARAFIIENLISVEAAPYLKRIKSLNGENGKGALQEYLQGKEKGQARPEYVTLEKTGPDHCPTFKVEVKAAGKSAVAEGKSKAEAEQAAAKELLKILKK